MLECTWNDTEAETALRRLELSEKKPEKPTMSDPRRTSGTPESSASLRRRLEMSLSLRSVGVAGKPASTR